jgi:hypothetical protein
MTQNAHANHIATAMPPKPTGFERRAEELIEQWAPHLVPQVDGEFPAYWRRVQQLAQELQDAETDRALEVFARWRA